MYRRALPVVFGILIMTSACSDDPETASDLRTGQFLDSAIEGLRYRTATFEGTTDVNGAFEYRSGETIQFSIGEIPLPTVAAAPIITGLDLFNTDDPMNPSVVNLNRLFQSLDENANPDDGIDLTQLKVENTVGLAIDFGAETFAEQTINLVGNSGNNVTELVSEEAAMDHFEQTLAINALGASDCESNHPLVGESATFTTRFHDVVGKLTVMDDCTLEVTEFGYDGLGPRVFFYTGKDGKFLGPSAREVGPQLNGLVYINDSFRVTLPPDLTLDEVNSLSVWCADFAVSFGDAVLTSN